ncbi:hypothetical protein P8452_76176 [Trifolium repens]|nr:hypothetical protein P8452_76176 [Trifolium repens]
MVIHSISSSLQSLKCGGGGRRRKWRKTPTTANLVIHSISFSLQILKRWLWSATKMEIDCDERDMMVAVRDAELEMMMVAGDRSGGGY